MKKYDEITHAISKAISKSYFLSFIFSSIFLLFGLGLLFDFDHSIRITWPFDLIRNSFETPISNIINGAILIIPAILLFANGINKKWPKIN